MGLISEKFFAYALAVVLLVVGVVCYAAFAHRGPEEPIRIMLKATAGNVLFDHKQHASADGYGYECIDCHHAWEGEGTKPEACGECHEVDGEDPIKRSEAFHTQCMGCHEEMGTAPVEECSSCHAF